VPTRGTRWHAMKIEDLLGGRLPQAVKCRHRAVD
jgi:hypothetical protein